MLEKWREGFMVKGFYMRTGADFKFGKKWSFESEIAISLAKA